MARIDEDELIEHWTLIGGELAEVAPGIGARRGRCVGRFAVSRVAGWVAGRERRRAGGPACASGGLHHGWGSCPLRADPCGDH